MPFKNTTIWSDGLRWENDCKASKIRRVWSGFPVRLRPSLFCCAVAFLVVGGVLGLPFGCRAAPVSASGASVVPGSPYPPSMDIMQADGSGVSGMTLAAASTRTSREVSSGAAQKTGKKPKTTRKLGKIPSKAAKVKRSHSARPARKKAARTRPEQKARPPRSFIDVPEGHLSILVVGDSFAVGVGMGLETAFAGRSKVMTTEMGRVSSGLDSPGTYDWNRELKEALNHQRFDLVVVMLGANDAHNGPGTAAWGRQYQSKFSNFLRICSERHIRTLVVGLPPMKKTDFTQRVEVTNEAIKNASREFPNVCVYIDSFSRFSDGSGRFTDSIMVRGELKKVRAADGVHFTGTGYLLLSKMVAEEALRRLGAVLMDKVNGNWRVPYQRLRSQRMDFV